MTALIILFINLISASSFNKLSNHILLLDLFALFAQSFFILALLLCFYLYLPHLVLQAVYALLGLFDYLVALANIQGWFQCLPIHKFVGFQMDHVDTFATERIPHVRIRWLLVHEVCKLFGLISAISRQIIQDVRDDRGFLCKLVDVSALEWLVGHLLTVFVNLLDGLEKRLHANHGGSLHLEGVLLEPSVVLQGKLDILLLVELTL